MIGFIGPLKRVTTFRLDPLYFLPHYTNPVLEQSQSHSATDGQSICKSWCRAPSGAHDQIFITLRQLRS
jgi:hypothetical protein